MGGKQGSSTSQVEIPEEFKAMLIPFVQDSLNRYDRFATEGSNIIMPQPGETNVDVKNPWALKPMPGDPVDTDSTNIADTGAKNPNREDTIASGRRASGGGRNQDSGGRRERY